MSDTHADILHRYGLRATGPRLAILEALHELGGTADVAEMHRRLCSAVSLHKTTLYRNLEALERIGIVRRVFDGQSAFRYELACEHGPAVHPHFQCRKCGKLFCLEPVDVPAEWSQAMGERGFKTERAEVRFIGLCKNCG